MKGRSNIRITGILFFLSALYQLLSFTSPVLFFGTYRSGLPAVFYHLIYFILFALIGSALWSGRTWGVKIILMGTITTTLERLMLLLHKQSMQLHIDQILWNSPDLELLVDEGQIQLAFHIVNILILLGWWGLAYYMYYRRDYFQPIHD